MTTSPQRQHAIGEFFTAHAERVQRSVAARAHDIAAATIQDACQIAWAKLLRRPDVTLDAHGVSWLITVAIREAWRLGRGMSFVRRGRLAAGHSGSAAAGGGQRVLK